jgi:hypothetical protein
MNVQAWVYKTGNEYVAWVDEGGAFRKPYVVTPYVQRLIDEATKELREWREAIMTENERLNDENRSLRKQINIMGFAYDSLKRLYDSNRGDRPER